MSVPLRHLIVMAKAPRLGRVKTRLAADIGAVAAAGFYRRTLTDVTRRLAGDTRWQTWLGVTPDRDIADDRLWPAGPDRIAQGTGDLGRRMTRLLTALPPGPAVLVGADIPAIRPGHIWDAFQALGRDDAVFGPAADGGYWLIGLARRRFAVRALTGHLFHAVRWSGPHALADTRANLPAGAEGPALVVLEDIDDAAAFARFFAPVTG